MRLFGRRPFIRFSRDRRGRRIVIGGLSKAERAKLRCLLAPLAIRKGTISLRKDWLGRTHLVLEDIPERYHQPVRNLVGNLPRL